MTQATAGSDNRPVVVGITGASGSILGFQLVKQLLTLGLRVELVMTEKSHQVTFDELQLKITGSTSAEKAQQLVAYMGLPIQNAEQLAVYPNHRLDAPPSSGTHLTRGMVIIPCSMGTLGRISSGIGDNLVARSADVTIKEHRKLILVTRESPMSAIHLRNQLTLAQLGVVILPPMLTFYLPDYHSMDGQIAYVVGKVLDQLGVVHNVYARWGSQPQQL
jgi:flavin prenyltransferase